MLMPYLKLVANIDKAQYILMDISSYITYSLHILSTTSLSNKNINRSSQLLKAEKNSQKQK